MNKPKIIYVMGVSGCGKSTIGTLLAKRLGFTFFDGDDYHPKANVEKMSRGTALNDEDRKGWLQTINQIAKQHKENGAIIVCSALKEKYREELKKGLGNDYGFLYLKGSMDDISKRLSQRKGHYMPKALLQSQFDTLEAPKDAISISILQSPEAMVNEYIKRVSL